MAVCKDRESAVSDSWYFAQSKPWVDCFQKSYSKVPTVLFMWEIWEKLKVRSKCRQSAVFWFIKSLWAQYIPADQGNLRTDRKVCPGHGKGCPYLEFFCSYSEPFKKRRDWVKQGYMTNAVFSNCCEMLLHNSDGCARAHGCVTFRSISCAPSMTHLEALKMDLNMNFKASDVFSQNVCNGGHKMEKRIR